MSHLQIFDRALCCSTGVCGPQVDPELPTIAADLEWLKQQGHTVDRFNLAHEPERFSANVMVQKWLQEEGVECLPICFLDGEMKSRSSYPTRDELASWTGTKLPPKTMLPLANEGGCCDDSNCC